MTTFEEKYPNVKPAPLLSDSDRNRWIVEKEPQKVETEDLVVEEKKAEPVVDRWAKIGKLSLNLDGIGGTVPELLLLLIAEVRELVMQPKQETVASVVQSRPDLQNALKDSIGEIQKMMGALNRGKPGTPLKKVNGE